MAHVVPGLPSSGGTRFPKHYAMSKWNEDHLRFEADAYELEVIGDIPKSIHGAFYRVQPDHAFPPIFAETEIPLNGDGNVSAFYIKDGHVDFKQRYVKTPKLLAERAARKALFGRYRNKYTDDPLVQNVIKGTTANTHVVFHDNKLMALKEDTLPMELDPITLETRGYIDYHGTLRSPTHTAHPKADSTTGELVSYGYEVEGDASPDISLFTVDKNGRVTDEVWFKAPWPCMIHDFWVTENWVVFPVNGIKASLEQMKQGADHFYWDESLDYQLLGVIPRRGAKPEDAKWFKTPQGCYSHTINAYEEEGNVVLDANVWTDLHFAFLSNTKGERFFTDPRKVKAPIIRYRFDPSGSTEEMIQPEGMLLDGVNEFGRIDDRLLGKKYSRVWILKVDPTYEIRLNDHELAVGNVGFNTLVCYNFDTGEIQSYRHGDDSTFQEPVFVPRYAGADYEDGYLLVVADRYREGRNTLLLFEASDITKGPLAEIKLPFKLMDGLHGSWVEGKDVDAAREASAKRTADGVKHEN
ncbi:related to lignostilbene dioxygenase [Cephalotrichum gorgonifer]|uniref:Related to lignostilbene dioxygenase n=1 Tax=Cephalotrichum gorgonifer TaxID=2041049 RepID=A0AAE8SQI9_9PEZI|nr:related to lignostilbene dioxygenase [Cephalotrichum gorgonifer]